MVKEIGDINFNEEVINADTTVAVDFWAPWCGPCKMLAPIIHEVSDELVGKAKFVKMNVDDNPASSQKFRIASIPTVMIFKNGKVVETLVGFRPKQEIKALVEKHI